ncbi:hypothetical protein PMI34_01168 [Pseudomonas sp. GM74]|uniref:hypothetical protein n=1 Tax=Pseudomonas sp. GM74 TaxID=1144336 RepID=UPI0002705ACA|nr:hypothetical protein [Pseudomonas sp. GM74]EJM94424.1 hypothetical protein PMI34_01168 [Pseudomonas sp. GM74]
MLIYDKFLEEMGVDFVLTGYVCDYSKLIGARFGEPVAGTVECSALVFDGEKHCYAAYGEKDGLCKTPVWLERPYVIGSGQDHAMTAMEMGATAAESGEMAQKRDTSTGGVVRTLFVADRATAR